MGRRTELGSGPWSCAWLRFVEYEKVTWEARGERTERAAPSKGRTFYLFSEM